MAQVTRHSLNLIEEHPAIADRYFPTAEASTQYLTNQRTDVTGEGQVS